MRKLRRTAAMAMAASMVLSMGAMNAMAEETTSEAAAEVDTVEAAEISEMPDVDYEECKLTLSWWGGDTRHEATQKAVAAFEEAYPGITIECDYGAWTDWETKIAQQLASGQASDIMQVNWNWLYSMNPDGANFADLNEYSDIIDLKQFDQSLLDTCTVSDKLSCIPVSVTGRVYWWNKATFDKAGIDIPTTKEELLAAGNTFKEVLGDDYYPMVLGSYDKMLLMTFYLESVYDKPWVKDNTLQYTAEEIQDGIQFIQDLEDNHVIPTAETLIGDGSSSIDQNANWTDGHYAGIFEWDSSASKFASALADDQELVVGDYVKLGDTKGGFKKVSLGFAITETCEHKTEAALFLQYVLNYEDGALIMGSERGIPASKTALALCEENTVKADDGTEKPIIDPMVAEANGKMMDWVSFDLDPLYESATLKSTDGGYADVFDGLSYGDYDVAEAADALIGYVNEVLEAGVN